VAENLAPDRLGRLSAMDLQWWIAVIGVPLVGALFALDFYIHRTAQNELERKIEAKDAEIGALHNRVNSVSKELYDYKVTAAMMFSTSTAVGEVKRELMNALSRIEDKLDRIGERNDRRDHT
jgi:hypothetical protein